MTPTDFRPRTQIASLVVSIQGARDNVFVELGRSGEGTQRVKGAMGMNTEKSNQAIKACYLAGHAQVRKPGKKPRSARSLCPVGAPVQGDSGQLALHHSAETSD